MIRVRDQSDVTYTVNDELCPNSDCLANYSEEQIVADPGLNVSLLVTTRPKANPTMPPPPRPSMARYVPALCHAIRMKKPP